MGRGLSMRLSTTNQVLIGSRSSERGERVAKEIKTVFGGDIGGGSNAYGANACDSALLAIPSLVDARFLEALKVPLKGKMVISPIAPMHVAEGLLVPSKKLGSAAEEIASGLKESRVVAALHHIPASTLLKTDMEFDFDVLVACDSRTDYDEASAIIRSIKGLRPLYAGPLFTSTILESITPLLINAARLNKLSRLSLKLVS